MWKKRQTLAGTWWHENRVKQHDRRPRQTNSILRGWNYHLHEKQHQHARWARIVQQWKNGDGPYQWQNNKRWKILDSGRHHVALKLQQSIQVNAFLPADHGTRLNLPETEGATCRHKCQLRQSLLQRRHQKNHVKGLENQNLCHMNSKRSRITVEHQPRHHSVQTHWNSEHQDRMRRL